MFIKGLTQWARLVFGIFSKYIICLLIVSLGFLVSCNNKGAPEIGGVAKPCTSEWFKWVDKKLKISGDDGHGPDLGSMEWMGVVNFKIYGENAHGPDFGSEEWCNAIDSKVKEMS